MSIEVLVLAIEWYVIFLFSTVCHEAAHALAALRLGDRTAYYGGQVSLDPVPHIRREPIGMIAVPLLTVFYYEGQWMMGWASAPYDPMWALRYPKRSALMALAGPMANLTLVVIAAALIRFGLLLGIFERGQVGLTTIVAAPEPGIMTAFATLVSILFSLNLVLCLFNLLPLPPLDGSALPPLILDESTSRRYLEFVRSPGFSVLGLLLAWHVFPRVFTPVFVMVYRTLFSL